MILYTTTDCPNCKKLKDVLKKKGIKFTENNNIEEMKKLGIRSVPQLKIGEKLLNFGEVMAGIEGLSNKHIDARNLMASTKFYEGYSRFDEKLGRYETWDESVRRVINMHREVYADKLTPELDDLLNEVEEAYKDKLFLGSQRALQFGGEQLKKHNSRSYNCTASHCDRPDFFGGMFYLLLSGAGVGMSVQKQHIAKLPGIQKRKNNLATYVIPDSIEGWASSIDVLLSSYFVSDGVYPEYKGQVVNFDFREIRPEGSFISGGFKAPGAEPLERALKQVENLIEKELEAGAEKLRPIVAYDIAMYIADAVISGGIRRSAVICMFSKDDEEMIKAKTGDWFVTHPQRGRSNNSVTLLRGQTTKEEFHEIMKSVKDIGEPGFIWTDNLDFTYNPCVTKDTLILTDNGTKRVEDLIGEPFVAIVDGEEYASTEKGFWKTGDKNVYKLITEHGYELRATANHKILTIMDGKEEWKEMQYLNQEDKIRLNHNTSIEDVVESEYTTRVISVEYDGFEDVYDATIPIVHRFDANGIIVHNCVEVGLLPRTSDGRSGFGTCNLTEINGAKSISKEIFYKQCKVASILGTIQAGYTDFKFLTDATKELVERDALIGVGITGMMTNPDILFDEEVLKEGARIVKYWNEKVADILGINHAQRTTVIKPSGNSSVLLECSSGIHGEHSKRYIRHIQLNKNTDIAKAFMEINPGMCEPSLWRDSDIVVAFPVESDDKAVFKKDLLGVKQLEYVKKVQQTWIEEGTNFQESERVNTRIRHNVSNTITVDDWDEVEDYIFDNQKYLCGVSLLASTGDLAYPQAPFREVYTYQELVDEYGDVALFTSALIEAGTLAFKDDLWTACNTALGFGEKLTESHNDLLKRDFVRRFNKFSKNFESKEECANCLKKVYTLHKWWKIRRDIKDIDWSEYLKKEKLINADTLASQGCVGGQCEI